MNIYWGEHESDREIIGEEFRPHVNERIIEKTPDFVGLYRFSGSKTSIEFYKKPMWIHRVFSKLLIGLVWEDIVVKKTKDKSLLLG